MIWTTPGTIAYTASEAAFHVHDPTSYLQRVINSHIQSSPAEEEFVAKEQVNKSTHPPASEGTSSDDDTIVTSNVNYQSADANGACPIHPTGNHKWGECQLHQAHSTDLSESLRFSAIPSNSSNVPDNLAADIDQAELMRWHHRLGHLPFPQLHALAGRGEIPKRLIKIKPPFCAGGAFGV